MTEIVTFMFYRLTAGSPNLFEHKQGDVRLDHENKNLY